MSDVDLRARIGAAMLDAAIEAFRKPGETGAIGLNLDIAQHGAVVAMAMLIEADPDVATDQDIIRTCEFIAAQVASQVQTFREEFEAVGGRPWLIQPGSEH